MLHKAETHARALQATRRIMIVLALAWGACGHLPAAQAEASRNPSFSLFGSPGCTEWTGMTADARLAWTRAYLSTISKAYLEIRGANSKARTAQDIDQAVAGMDQYCAKHPGEQASEGLTPFLQ